MRRKILLDLYALLLGIIISFTFLEISIVIYNGVKQTVKGNSLVLTAKSDEVRRYPNVAGLEPEIHIHQNSLGFRGADPPADFADQLSIITIGGSTTRSNAQSDDRTWTALVGGAAANCFDRIWINNAGFDGHTLFAHIQLIRDYISKLHPKVIVMLVGANELFVDSGPVVEYRNLKLAGGFRGFINGLLYRSEVVALGLTVYRSFRAWREGLNVGFNWTDIEGPAIPPGGQAKLDGARDRQPAYAERLRLAIRLLREEGALPVLLTQPTLGGTGRDPTTGKDLSHFRHGTFFYQAFDIYNSTMRQVAQFENVHLIDLAKEMPKDTEYYYDYMHYTDAGAKKVAQLITLGLLPYLGEKFPSFDKGTCQIFSRKAG